MSRAPLVRWSPPVTRWWPRSTRRSRPPSDSWTGPSWRRESPRGWFHREKHMSKTPYRVGRGLGLGLVIGGFIGEAMYGPAIGVFVFWLVLMAQDYDWSSEK